MVALARLTSAMTPQSRGAAPRTLLSAVGAHSRALLARAQAPAHAASAVRVQAVAGRAGVAWTTLRDGVHRRSFATAAAAPAADTAKIPRDFARILPPVRSPPSPTQGGGGDPARLTAAVHERPWGVCATCACA